MRKYKNIIWLVLKSIVGVHAYELIRSGYNLKYIPDFKEPVTFNEKIIHRKIYGDMNFAIELADKYAVREYVTKKVGEEFLAQIFYVGEDLDNVGWALMPNQFVVKTTHGGGDEGNEFVFDKEIEGLNELTRKVNANLKKRFGYWTNENWYLKISPRIIIEELLLDERGNIPSDYKFFCFHGKCHFVQVNSNRYGTHGRSFYDLEWKMQNFHVGHIPAIRVEKPDKLKEMCALAEKLSEDFDFVRVDLYSTPSGIKFGELTFTPNGGQEAFHPRSVDYEWGALF